MNVQKAVIFDMDGTLADNTHRRHHVETKPKNWPAFNAGIEHDAPNVPIVDLARLFAASDLPVVVCTGRERRYESVTREWMARHDVPCAALYMREDKDYRGDDIVKAELLAAIRGDGFEPVLVVDDRDRVVAMWRRAGLTCLQCAPGDF